MTDPSFKQSMTVEEEEGRCCSYTEACLIEDGKFADKWACFQFFLYWNPMDKRTIKTEPGTLLETNCKLQDTVFTYFEFSLSLGTYLTEIT